MRNIKFYLTGWRRQKLSLWCADVMKSEAEVQAAEPTMSLCYIRNIRYVVTLEKVFCVGSEVQLISFLFSTFTASFVSHVVNDWVETVKEKWSLLWEKLRLHMLAVLLCYSTSLNHSTLTDVHHVVVHAVNRDLLHEVVGVVSPLRTLWQVCVVLKQAVEELQMKKKNHTVTSRLRKHVRGKCSADRWDDGGTVWKEHAALCMVK